MLAVGRAEKGAAPAQMNCKGALSVDVDVHRHMWHRNKKWQPKAPLTDGWLVPLTSGTLLPTHLAVDLRCMNAALHQRVGGAPLAGMMPCTGGLAVLLLGCEVTCVFCISAALVF